MIPQGHKTNFETLKLAAANEDLALMECLDATTGSPVVVICAVNRCQGELEFVPVARMFNNNPYDEVIPASSNAA